MARAADVALRKLEEMMASDPVLRDVVTQALPRPRRAGQLVPEVDVVERDAAWEVLVEVPGVPRDALVVELLGNRLLVSGDKPLLRGDGQVRVGERRTGAFRREFVVPWSVDASAVRAQLKDGVLTIRLPRGADGGGRRIVVDG